MYKFEDIMTHRLPLDIGNRFIQELAKLSDYSITTMPDSLEKLYNIVGHLINRKVVLEDYHNSVEYIFAKNNVERAKIAMNAKVITDFDDKILKMWLKYANEMSDFEKVMAGWKKI